MKSNSFSNVSTNKFGYSENSVVETDNFVFSYLAIIFVVKLV